MEKLPIVISASRMTDMPAFYPKQIIDEIELRKSKGFRIHSIVLWTKHANAIFREPLYTYLKEQQVLGTQICVQLTITGIGKDSFIKGINNQKVYLEPCVPDLAESLSFLDKLIGFTGNPARIRLRIDPLVRLKDIEGNIFSNYEMVQTLVEIAQPKGISLFSFSFLEKDVYTKIDHRFFRRGIDIIPPDKEERALLANKFSTIAAKYNIIISACSIPGLPSSACIDGKILRQLHNENWPLDLTRPHSRDLCHCTKSIDIGGWPPKRCKSGCLYCYSRPLLDGVQ